LRNTVITLFNNPNENKKISGYTKTLIIVCIAQLFSGLGLAAGLTVGALIAQEMIGLGAFAGVPVAMLTIGSAFAAYIIGRSSNRWGRRAGLTFGFLVGAIGAGGVVVATAINNIALLMIALFLYGSGMASNLQARYAGTDLAQKRQRATAISIAMFSTTLGVVLGPNLVEEMGLVAMYFNLPILSGVFLLSTVSFLIASLIIFILLRPDPLKLSKVLQSNQLGQVIKFNEQSQSTSTNENRRGIVVGTVILLLNQIVMVAIMTMTPVHMEEHGHQLKDIGLVISLHMGSMYLPSLITGILIDKLGRIKMAIASGVILIAAALTTALAPGSSLIAVITGLSLLGIGWNCGLISGTALIVDSTSPATRAKKQGIIDVFIALAGASGGMVSGIIVASYSYTVLSFVGVILSLIFIPLMLWSKK